MLLLVGGATLGSPAVRGSAATGRVGATPAPTRASAAVPLGEAIDAVLAGEPGDYGVMVAGADGERLYGRGADAPFVAASLYKLVLMVAVEEARVAGELALDNPVLVEGEGWISIGDALEATITWSDNEAAMALWETVGIDGINAAAAGLGMEDTCVACDPVALPIWPAIAPSAGMRASRAEASQFVLDASALGWVNLTTPRDIARFYGLLLDGEVVDRSVSTRMLHMLRRQQVNDRFPALLPKGTVVAHKTGNLPGVVHDAGVIYTPAGPVVLVVLAQDVPDECRASIVQRRIAALVYAAHGGRVPIEPAADATTGCV